jgi:hypothetical protein
MLKDLVVTFDHKSYTWDGKRWYGTEDYLMPPLSIVYRLNAMIPAPPAKEKAAPARRK